MLKLSFATMTLKFSRCYNTGKHKAESESPAVHALILHGKAAWQMAAVADERLADRIDTGVVITKHGYSKGQIRDYHIYESGHPVPDEKN